MNFKYTALGSNHQKLEGILDANTPEEARESLHKMGLSVVAISKIEVPSSTPSGSKKISQSAEGIETYYFIARDLQGKEINGTIDAKNASVAYRRLLTEYHFDVMDIYPSGSNDPQTDSSKSQFELWKKTMEEEGVDFSEKPAFGVKEELQDEQKMNQVIEDEIDSFIINTKKILNDHKANYSEVFLKEITQKLNELERIRSSNNMKHITRVCNDLYELVSNPDLSQEENPDEATSSDYSSTLSKLEESGFVANRFQFVEAHRLQKKAAGFQKIQNLFGKINKVINLKKANNTIVADNENSGVLRQPWLKALRNNAKTPPSALKLLAYRFFDYLQTSTPVLRQAKKQELIKSYRQWNDRRKKIKQDNRLNVFNELKAKNTIDRGEMKPKRDFSVFFMELNSFTGWLLFFYLAYFFLASFSIEKNIGLPEAFILKTLSSPLMINISIFLLVAHVMFVLKLGLFRKNFFGSLFLFFLGFSFYSLLIVNF